MEVRERPRLCKRFAKTDEHCLTPVPILPVTGHVEATGKDPAEAFLRAIGETAATAFIPD
jgi:hypothetical protein